MQFRDKLNLHLSALITRPTFTLTQLHALIRDLPEQTGEESTLLGVLAIAYAVLVQKEERITEQEALGLLIKGLAQRVRFSQPLSFLTACEFQRYNNYCLNSSEQLRKVGMQTYGLYPLHLPGASPPPSIYLQRGNTASSGNPHWLVARTALKEYYEIRGSKSAERVKEIYLFLLGDRRLLDMYRRDPFKLFWTNLYFRYNTEILQPYLQEKGMEVTWERLTAQQLIESTRPLQQQLSLYERLLYYLSLTILSEYQPYSALSSTPLSSAFSSFLKTEKQYSPHCYLIALLIFRLIAQGSEAKSLQEQCMARFLDFAIDEDHVEYASPFLHFLMDEQGVLSYALLHQVALWKMPMPHELKRKVAQFQTVHGVFFPQSIDYIDKKMLVEHVFRSTFLPNPTLGRDQLKRLEADPLMVLSHLRELAPDASLQDLMGDFERFVALWRKYYELMQVNSLEVGEQALQDSPSFHPSTQPLFLTPRQSGEAVFNIVIRMARAFRAKVGYFSSVPSLRQKMEAFQNQVFPKLSPVLSEHQRDQFWKEWIEILKADPAFVGEIMRTAQ